MADGREQEHRDGAAPDRPVSGPPRRAARSGPVRVPRWRAAALVIPRRSARGPGVAARPTGGRRIVRALAVGLAALVLLTAGAGAYVYLRLNGNLRQLPLFGGVYGDAGTERPDAFGRTPLNVLVIGSDTRADPADCRLGGDCGPGRNADVEMLLHLSADRSHATALSIPRDTVTDLPACRRPRGGVAPARRGPVNSSLQYGPGCTVAAVHTLTGIPIDHFVLVDFAGVVRMSDAVGGVPVCVDRDVYDPYSRLKLARGRHALAGQAALEFLRSRHAFGDGSDLGRADAQHLYLVSLLRRMRGSGSPADPAGLLSLADAATRSLTVDPGLAAVSRLAGLASDVRKVPAERFSFTTMPSAPDPSDPARLVVAPAARGLFAALAADRAPRIAAGAGSGGGRRGPAPRPAATPTTTGAATGAATGAGTARASDEALGSTAPAPAAPGITAASGTACAEVATGRTVTVGGRAMTPTQAFAATPRVPVSAK
ncbi:LCP family protein [Streptomyces sp. HPF1205]|uniref:LCP family protein n=1 Tax=Streptomyces sp. HPF1205 TaxID=2873262 RepID=UPI001CEC84AB|nr:LCP family protein [Streptomyces sp. HPF1205]